MPIPVFLQSNQVPIGALAPLGALPPSGGPPGSAGPPPGGAGSSGSIPFAMQFQQQDNWCWAAVSTSVSKFFAGASAWLLSAR